MSASPTCEQRSSARGKIFNVSRINQRSHENNKHARYLQFVFVFSFCWVFWVSLPRSSYIFWECKSKSFMWLMSAPQNWVYKHSNQHFIISHTSHPRSSLAFHAFLASINFSTAFKFPSHLHECTRTRWTLADMNIPQFMRYIRRQDIPFLMSHVVRVSDTQEHETTKFVKLPRILRVAVSRLKDSPTWYIHITRQHRSGMLSM